MRYILFILLFPLVSYGQGTYKWTVGNGEYTQPAIDSIGRAVLFSGNLGLTGNSGSGTTCIPLAVSGTGTTFVYCNNTLHGGTYIDVSGNVWWTGNNTDGEGGLPGGASAGNLVKILVDSRGVSFTNITLVQGSYIQIGSNDISGQYFVKHGTLSDSVFYAGVNQYGMGGDGTTGSTTYFTPQLMFGLPSGQRIKQMCSESGTAMLLNNGQVFTWGAAGTASYLGRTVTGSNYATPVQVTGFDDSIVQIVGGAECGMIALSKNDSLWGWGPNAGYLGNGGNPSYSTPHNLGDSLKRYVENGTTRTKILQIAANSNSFHILANDSTLWGWGDNGMGSIGNGIEANLASPGGTSTPWFIDPSAVLVLAQTHPVQVTKRHNFIYVSTGCLFSFGIFALDATGILYSCGRNKGGVIPNGVIECAGDGGDLSSFYPNSWDVPWLTPVNPYGVTASIQQTCQGCHTGAVTANCHSCGTTTSATANAGSNQNITTSTTTLNGSASFSTTGKIVYYVWTQLSGAASTIDVPAAITPNISGLTSGTYVYQLAVQDQGFNTSTANVTVTVGQTGYYVSSSSGSDGNSGTLASPYATIAKAISSSVSGDTIYLKGGDTFNGTVYPITGLVFEPYSGADPVVSGLTTLTGWTNEGGGIYGKLCTGCKVSTNLVITDGVVDHMARFPNTGYRTFTAITSSTFTDATLSNSPSYIGSTAVLKDERYIIDTVHVTGQSSGVVSIASAPGSTDLNGHGYFFENLFSLLDTANEFYINAATDTLYVFSADPITGHTIQVSTSDSGFYFNHVNNVTVNGIKITGFNQYNIFTNTDTSILITNCPILYGGNDGVHSNQCVKCSYISDTIQYSNNNGVTATGSNTNHKVYQSCQVTQNGLLPGMGHSGGGGTYEGINDPLGFATFSLNNIHHNGSSGLTVGGDSLNVFNNHCHHDGQIKSDGAEIYTHDASVISYTYHRNINANICDHAFNDSAGVLYLLSDVNFGIYPDAAAGGLFIFSNTCDSNSSAGIFNHGPNNSITGNNLFGNYYFQSVISEVSPFTITGLIYKNNTHGFSGSTPNSLSISSTANDLSSFGIIDSNYYLCPIGLLSTLMTKSSVDGGTLRTLSNWTTNTTYDAHSSYLNSILLFQSSVSGGTFTLPTAYKSANGTLFNRSITLSPYSSAILIPFGNPIYVPFGNKLIAL